LTKHIGSPSVGWEKLDAMCLGVNGSEVASKMNASDWKDKWKIGLYYIIVTNQQFTANMKTSTVM